MMTPQQILDLTSHWREHDLQRMIPGSAEHDAHAHVIMTLLGFIESHPDVTTAQILTYLRIRVGGAAWCRKMPGMHGPAYDFHERVFQFSNRLSDIIMYRSTGRRQSGDATYLDPAAEAVEAAVADNTRSGEEWPVPNGENAA
jgi:hypothetical protein